MNVRKSKTNKQNEREESDVFVEYIFNGRCYYYLLLSSSFFVHFFVVVFFTVSKSAILFIWRVEIVKNLNWDSPTILSIHIPSQHMPHSVRRLDLHSSLHWIYVNDSSKWLWRIVHSKRTKLSLRQLSNMYIRESEWCRWIDDAAVHCAQRGKIQFQCVQSRWQSRFECIPFPFCGR